MSANLGRSGVAGASPKPDLVLNEVVRSSMGWSTSAMTAFVYVGAAFAEIAGCFAFWAWLRLDKPIWWLAPGIASLCLFAYLLTLVDAEHAGRAYAA